MNILLEDANVYKRIECDNMKKEQRSFNSQLKDILKLNLDLINKFTTRLPKMPYLYGLPKIHKDGCPMRPIISTVGSMSYGLSKWLAEHLAKYLGKISDSHLINSMDLISRIKDINLDGCRMVSFDVVSLFTNVPLDETLNFLDRFFNDNNDKLPLGKKIFFKLLRLALSINTFAFNNCYYNQIFGLSMGNPLSPVLSNLFMECLEKYVLKVWMDKRIVWLRYVDDILAIIPEDVCMDEFLVKLNEMSKTIKFTIEHENENGLPFLDLNIIRGPNGFPLFKIYRKPTHTDSYLHGFSSHQKNVKRGVVSGLFLRALRLCSTCFLEDEIKKIKETFKKLGYCDRLINEALMKARRTYYSTKEEKERKERLIVLPICDIKELNVIPKDVDVIFKNFYNIGSIVKTKNNTLVNNKAGLYAMPCGTCESLYIGETSDFLRRSYQHKYALRTNSNGAWSKHLKENPSHVINVDSIEMFGRVEDEYTRSVIESYIVKNCKSSVNNCKVVYNMEDSLKLILENSKDVNKIKNNFDLLVERWKGDTAG